MPSRLWSGNAGATNQIWQYPAANLTPPLNSVVQFTIGSKFLQVPGSATMVSDIIAAWQKCQYPEFKEVTPSLVAALNAAAPTIAPNPCGSGANDHQTVTITGGPTGGTYTLGFEGQTTTALAYNATAATVQIALQKLSTIGPGNCTVSGAGTPANPFLVRFVGVLGLIPVSSVGNLLGGNAASLTGGTSPAIAIAVAQIGVSPDTSEIPGSLLLTAQAAGRPFTVTTQIVGESTPSISISITYGVTPLNEIQNIWIGTSAVNEVQEVGWQVTAPANGVASGTWTITWNSITTGAIVAQPTVAALQTILGAAYGAGNVTCNSSFTTTTGLQVIQKATITFTGIYAGTDVPQATTNATGVTYTLGSPVTPFYQTDTQGNNGSAVTGGTFTLSFGGHTTTNIAYNATAATVQAALQALASIGAGNVTVTGSGTSANPWQVSFTGALAASSQALITGNGSGLTGGGQIAITETQLGSSTGVDEIQYLGLSGTGSGLDFCLALNYSNAGRFGFFPPAQQYTPYATTSRISAPVAARDGINLTNIIAAMPNVGTGNVVCTYLAPGVNPNPNLIWKIEFVGALAKRPIPLLQVVGSRYETLNPIPPTFAISNLVTGGAGVNAQQLIDINLVPNSGAFTLVQNNKTIGPLVWNAQPQDISNAFLALGGTVDVMGTDIGAGGGPFGSFPFVLEYDLTLGGISWPLVSVGQNGLFAFDGNPSSVGYAYITEGQQGNPSGIDEKQLVTLVNAPTAGSFTLAWGGNTTPSCPAPGTPTLTLNTTAGNLKGYYRYVVTFVDGSGETIAGIESPTLTTFNQQIDLSNIPLGPAGTVSRKIYRTAGNGGPGTELLLHTIADNTTTSYTDNIADASLGAAPPGVATAVVPTPGCPTVAASGSAGSPNGAYLYRITFTNANGETTTGTDSASVTVVSHQINLTNIPLGPSGTTARNIYRTAAAGAAGTELLLHTIADNTTTSYTDNIADGSLGATYPVVNTTGIAHNASAATVQTALQALSTIGSGNITVTGSAGGPWTVEFIATLGDTPQALITGDPIYLAGAVVNIVEQTAGRAGGTQVENIVINGAAGGTFTLSFNGATTPQLAYGASAATVQTALQALSTIGSGNITVTGAGTAASPYVCTFAGTLVNQQLSPIIGNAANLLPFSISTTQLPTILEKGTGPNYWDNTNNWAGTVPQGAVVAPTAVAAAAVSGGSLSATTYYYKITATNANGETTASNEVSATTSGGNLSVLLSWNATPWATGYKVYRGTVTNTENVLVATIASGAQVIYTDVGAATTSVSPPVSNTAVGDDVYYSANKVGLLYNIAPQSPVDLSAPTLNSWQPDASYTGPIGLPVWNALGYYEYRPTYLAVNVTTPSGGVPNVIIGQGKGSGSPLIKLNTGTSQVLAAVSTTAPSADVNAPSIIWLGVNSSTEWDIFKGSFGSAIYPGDVATLATIRQTYQTNQTGDTYVQLGAGVTITTLNKNGGDTQLACSLTTLTADAGTIIQVAGVVTGVMTLENATYTAKNTGTMGTVNLGAGGAYDRRQSSLAVTITNTNMYAKASLLDPNGSVVFTNPLQLVKCGIGDVTLDLGSNISLARVDL